GQAQLSGILLTPGNHAVAVVYSGDASFTGSGSTMLAFSIGQTTTTTTLDASTNTPVTGQPVTLTATVHAGAPGTPTGSVTFVDGSTVLGTAWLNADGVATMNTDDLHAGSHTITAVYSGDADCKGSTSPALTRDVGKAATKTSLVVAPNPVLFGQLVTFTA